VDAAPSLYRGHRFPVEIINHCVWLYYRFPLSLRDIQEMMAQRGVIVSYETIHQWCRKFGQSYANRLRRRRARPGDKWHLTDTAAPSPADATGDTTRRTASVSSELSQLPKLPADRPRSGWAGRLQVIDRSRELTREYIDAIDGPSQTELPYRSSEST
jgi:hypothetical protein